MIGRSFLVAAIAVLCAVLPAIAQNTSGLVVSTCGTVPAAGVAGRPGPFTVDTAGRLCRNAPGVVSAGSVNGIPTSTGLVVGTCNSPPTPFVSGRPGPYTVNRYGNTC